MDGMKQDTQDGNTENSQFLLDKVNDDDDELDGCKCNGSRACDPKSCVHRYFPVLVLICSLGLGCYFCYENPAALHDIMMKALNIDEGQYMAFYSYYCWPNVVLCMFGGYLIDTFFGVRLGTIIFSLFVTIGQFIFSLGSFFNIYGLMCFGRFVFGIGGESLAVAQSTFTVKWFHEKELNMVFGLQLSFALIGTTVNMNIMQPVYNFIDKSLVNYKRLGITLLLEMIKFKDILTFPLQMWLIFIICVVYYVSLFPFIGLGMIFFQQKFGLSSSSANAVNSLVYTVSAFASPVFGFLIDKIGRNVYWVIIGVVLTLGCHMILTFSLINPYIPMVIMGLSYSVLASSLWPLVSYIIPIHQLGTAYGIMQAIQNLGLAVISLVAGIIVDKCGYFILEVFFMAWLCLSLIAGALLYLVDAAKGGKLNCTAKVRALEKQEHEREEEKLRQID